MTEKDFLRAEIEFVPAVKATDVGLDRSLVGAYGQDDKVCAYTALTAEMKAKSPEYTTVTILADKEEIGSVGNTGLNSDFTLHYIEGLCKAGNVDVRKVLKHSLCLSADVNAAYDPTFASVFEEKNSCYLNKGVVLTKYTGARGKSGSNDASAETMAKVIQIMDEVFHRFGIRVCIKMNNRKILSGIAEIIGEADKIVDITVAIDKLDKIGLDNVNEELRSKGLSEEAIARLQPIIKLSGTNREKLAVLKEQLATSEIAMKGIEEMTFILDRIDQLPMRAELELDLTLARGLNYYTGAIFEVKALDVQIGSITGGGRYDNLTGVFGMDGVSGVGISFGADRIFDVLNQLDLYPADSLMTTQLLFVNFGATEESYLLPIISQVRAAGIRSELFPETAKMKKQMGYADTKKIPFVAIVGETEMNEGKINLKNMITGEQKPVTVEELIAQF